MWKKNYVSFVNIFYPAVAFYDPKSHIKIPTQMFACVAFLQRSHK